MDLKLSSTRYPSPLKFRVEIPNVLQSVDYTVVNPVLEEVAVDGCAAPKARNGV